MIMTIPLHFIICGAFVILVIGLLLGNKIGQMGMTKFNINADLVVKPDGFLGPEFKVVKVEEAYDKHERDGLKTNKYGQTTRIAKYTIQNTFYSWKKDIYIFYDKLGQYNVGDILYLTKY